MTRQKRVWLSNKEYQRQKRLRLKWQAEEDAQRALEEGERLEEYKKQLQSQPKPSVGNYLLGSGDRTERNPTGQLGILPYMFFLVLFGILYKLSFGILPLVLVALFACGVGIYRWITKAKR